MVHHGFFLVAARAVFSLLFGDVDVTISLLGRRARVRGRGVNRWLLWQVLVRARLWSNLELLLDVSAIGTKNVLFLLLIRHVSVFECLEDLFPSKSGHDHAKRGAIFVADFALLRQVGKEPLDLRFGVLVDPRAA